MIRAYQDYCQSLIDPILEQLFQAPHERMSTLYEAMRYSVMNGGKRVRPLLVLASCEALAGDAKNALGAACAVELIHAYSLVHDDLPAMDDDDWRRGQPTTHIRYGQANAILAGDALQALAFEVLCDPRFSTQSDSTRLKMVQLLSQAAGAAGMVGGQAIDLDATGQSIDQAHLEQMHRHKTGALIRVSTLLGGLCSQSATPEALDSLARYAEAIGLAFQVQDDILDIISDTETLGKQQGSDSQQNKSTYPALLGLEQAQCYALQLRDQALAALVDFDENADTLRALAHYIVTRNK